MKTQTDQDKVKDLLIKELLKGCDSPESILGKSGLLSDLKKRLIESALDGELDNHLGYTKSMIPRVKTVVTAVMAGIKRL